MHFNPKLKTLSIHYYDSPYSHVDCTALNQLQKYVDDIVKGANNGINVNRNKIWLKRNSKAKCKNIMIRQRITHKTVFIKEL